MARYAALVFLLIVPLLILLPGTSHFFYPVGSEYSDLVITHLPNLVFLKNSLDTWGEVPLWSNTILSGYPFAANPLSGLWYPFTWVLLILPQPFGYNLVIFSHLLMGGLGAWFLLKLLGKSDWGALIGAITFELMPKLMAHFAAGHVTLVFAVCFTPWLMLTEIRRQKESGRFWRVAPGILLGFIALADIRWVPYAGLTWAFLVLSDLLSRKPTSLVEKKTPVDGDSGGKRLSNRIGGAALQFLIAVGIASPLLLPLIEYTALTTRSTLLTADRLAFSLPPARLLGLLFPDFGGYSEWVLYPGAFSLFSLLLIVSSRKLRKANRLWLLLLLCSFFIALGSANPLMLLISRLPGYEYLRVPTRVLFLAGLVFAALAASFTDWLSSDESKKEIHPGLILAVMALAVGLFFGAWYLTGDFNFELFWGAAFILIYAVIILMLRSLKRMKPFLAVLILLPMIVLDVGGVNFGGFQLRPADSVYAEGRDVADWLNQQAGKPFRVYSPSYSIPQLAGAAYQLELADGIDPMQLSDYVRFMAVASGVESHTYSVTLPAFETGHPEVDNSGAIPDAWMLGVLNVRFVVSRFPLTAAELALMRSTDEYWIYENLSARPRAWIQPGFEIQMDYAPVEIEEMRPNRIRLTAQGPGVVVLSENDYPGWEVRVDGQKSKLLRIDNLLRGVEIQPGEHLVEFRFRPRAVFAGLVWAVCTWVGMIFLVLVQNLKDREEKHAGD